MFSEEQNFTVRDYRYADAQALLTVFREAVSVTGLAAYNAQQVAAWLAAADDSKRFIARLEEGWIRVAEDEQGCIGFAQINLPGHLEMLYVTPRAGRQGVATALLGDVYELAGAMGAKALTVDASCIACPMLLKRGFAVKETETVKRVFEGKSVRIERLKMQKALT